jgi:hypothetical protein
VIEAGTYYESYSEVENEQDHIVPRRSLTQQQQLALFQPQIETETRKARQLDKRSGKMVETTDQRLVWKSDTSLLRRGKPDAFGESKTGTRFVRITSRSKRSEVENEVRIDLPEQELPGIELDIEL